jgi:hypothetical protein
VTANPDALLAVAANPLKREANPDGGLPTTNETRSALADLKATLAAGAERAAAAKRGQ